VEELEAGAATLAGKLAAAAAQEEALKAAQTAGAAERESAAAALADAEARCAAALADAAARGVDLEAVRGALAERGAEAQKAQEEAVLLRGRLRRAEEGAVRHQEGAAAAEAARAAAEALVQEAARAREAAQREHEAEAADARDTADQAVQARTFTTNSNSSGFGVWDGPPCLPELTHLLPRKRTGPPHPCVARGVTGRARGAGC
jgi:chromosome segregation protein